MWHGVQHFTTPPLNTFHWLPIANITDWIAQVFDFVRPLHMRLLSGHGVRGHCVMLRQNGVRDTLPRVAAWWAFWEIPKAGLWTLANELGADTNSKASFTEILFADCAAARGPLDDAESCVC